MYTKLKACMLISVLVLLIPIFAYSQITTNQLAGQVNAITSAVPFLTIAPDSRSGALGDAGVATSADANSMHWNPAKYAFTENDMGLSVSYTPWLRFLIDDINLSYLSGYKDLDDRQTIAFSLLYFSLGNITFTNLYGNVLRDFSPKELSLDAAYSFKMSKQLSTAIALRYIFSDLTGGIGETESRPGQTMAGDIAFYYQDNVDYFDTRGEIAWGINLSNIGGKISYTEDEKDFIPTNLRVGARYTAILDDFNSVSFTLDMNKLLIPTPYIIEQDPITGDIDTLGVSSDASVAVGIFQSFSDAPGVLLDDGTRSVFREEMHEIIYSAGIEYWYGSQFAIRTGYFHEHATKGNRKFFTVGLGLKLNVFGLDFAYLIPTQQRNPLQNTLRFSLIFDFEGFKKQNAVTE